MKCIVNKFVKFIDEFVIYVTYNNMAAEILKSKYPEYFSADEKSAAEIRSLRQLVKILQIENTRLKLQLKDFNDREIGYISSCHGERCMEWQAESYRDNYSEPLLQWCEDCETTFCKGHMGSDTLCVYCHDNKLRQLEHASK